VGLAPFEYSLDGTTWQSSNVFNGLIAGTYTVYYRESGGCMGQLTQTIAQPAPLAAAASSQAATCNGQSNGAITVVPTGGVSPYEYSINGGSSWQTANTFNVAAGTHTITIRDANQCTTSQTVTITEPASMTASAVTSNATCNGGNDGTITMSANGGNTSYTFSLDGTSFQPSNVFYTGPGTYNVTVKDNLGCTINVPNIVVDLTNDLSYTPSSVTTICEGTSTQLGITSNALQYSWSPYTGLNNPSISNPIANPTVTTTYIVTLTYGRCSTDVPVTVNVNAAPIPDAGADGYICYGQNFQLQGGGGTEFTWSPATFLNDANLSNPVSTPDKTIIYSLSVIDANGCQSLVTDQMKVDVTPPIKVSTFPFDTVAYEGEQFKILATSVATDYLWTPSTGLSNPGIPDPILTAGPVGDVIVYKVTASTQAGCKGEGYVRLRVYKGPDLYIPTGFTPNGDGRNDTFFPFPVGVKSIKYFRVFNRWGQMIYSTTTLNQGWDGKFGGIEQASGVYIWMVEGVTLDGRPITKKGTIMLIR
jgi:gliding motility-associated-like protein